MVTVKIEKAAGMSYANVEHNNHVVKQKDLKEIVKKLGMTVKEFAEITGDTPQALNSLKTSNPIKYEVNTLGITAKALNLNYDDLVLMASIKEQVKKQTEQ